jgi:hypothetical protein
MPKYTYFSEYKTMYFPEFRKILILFHAAGSDVFLFYSNRLHNAFMTKIL